MTAHLEGLLEIDFSHPPSKYGDDSSFSSPTGVVLRAYLCFGIRGDEMVVVDASVSQYF